MKYVRVPNLHMKRNMIEACHCCVHQCQSPKWRMLSTYIRRTIILEDVRQRNMEGSVLLYMKLDRWRVCLNFSTCFSPKSDHRSQHTFSSAVAVISHETFIYTSSMRSPYKKNIFYIHLEETMIVKPWQQEWFAHLSSLHMVWRSSLKWYHILVACQK